MTDTRTSIWKVQVDLIHSEFHSYSFKIIPSLKTQLKHAYNNCIDVKFIFDSVCLGMSSSANILQIADNYVALRVVFLLFLPCFQLLFHLVPAVVLTLEMNEMSAFFLRNFLQPNNQSNSTSSPGLLGNGALTRNGLHF